MHHLNCKLPLIKFTQNNIFFSSTEWKKLYWSASGLPYLIHSPFSIEVWSQLQPFPATTTGLNILSLSLLLYLTLLCPISVQSSWNMICDHINPAQFWCMLVKPVQTSGKRTETEAGKIVPEIMSTNNFRVYLPISSKPFKQSSSSFVWGSKPEPELRAAGWGVGWGGQSKSLIEHLSSYGLGD